MWTLCAPFHRYIYGILGFLLAFHLIVASGPLVLGMVMNAITEKDTRVFALAVLGLFFLESLRTYILYRREKYELIHLDFELARYLAGFSMKKFFEISLGQHRVGHSMIKRSVIAKGESSIAGSVYMAVYDLVPTVLMVVIPITFLLVRAWPVGLVVLAIVGYFTVYTFKYNARFVPRLRKFDSLTNRVGKKYGEVIQNAEVVYVNAQEDRVCRECDVEKSTEGGTGRPIWMSYIKWFCGGQVMVTFAKAICVTVSGLLTIFGKISYGTFVSSILWIGASLGTLSNISHIQRNFAKNLAPISKYFQFLDYEPDIKVPESPVPIENLRGRIEFRHVSFAYSSRDKRDSLNDDDDEEVTEVTPVESAETAEKIPTIKNVSFVLEEGKRHAFVGSSGAGKSTIVGLILRAFDPQQGHVLVDGVDLRMLDYRELRKHIGYVPQDVSLFDGTMRYNITFGLNGHAKDVTGEDLEQVAKLSRISEFAAKLEKGWDTLIGERGIKLSGGQRQRVGIARALIKNPQILIFDEATSSLDTENEAGIRESIQEASIGKTTLIIAHRLATVKDADKIFVFDEGRIVGEGTHEELLRTNEFYQRLVNNQVIVA